MARARVLATSTPSTTYVTFPCDGRVVAVRGGLEAFPGHETFEEAVGAVRAGFSLNGSNPFVRANDGLTAGHASFSALFGADLDRDALSDGSEGDGVCVKANDKMTVSFLDETGDGNTIAELVFWFEPNQN